jgi:hypothetical protein
MTQRRSHSLLSLAVVSVFVSLVMNYIVVESQTCFACRKLYCGFDDMCDLTIVCHIVVV